MTGATTALSANGRPQHPRLGRRGARPLRAGPEPGRRPRARGLRAGPRRLGRSRIALAASGAHVLPQALRDTGLLLAGVGVLVIVLGPARPGSSRPTSFPDGAGSRPGCCCPWRCRPISSPSPISTSCTRSARCRRPCGISWAMPARATSCCRNCARCRVASCSRLRALPVRLPADPGALPDAGRQPHRGGADARALAGRDLLPHRPADGAARHRPGHEPRPDGGPERHRGGEFLGVRTLTVQVYATWVNRSDLAGAAQIALVMLVAVVALVALERWARAGRGFAGSAQARAGSPGGNSPGFAPGGRSASGWCRWRSASRSPRATSSIPPSAGDAQRPARDARLRDRHTLLYAGVATVIAAVLGFVVAAGPRLLSRRFGEILIRVASLGYALPGAISPSGSSAPWRSPIPPVGGHDADLRYRAGPDRARHRRRPGDGLPRALPRRQHRHLRGRARPGAPQPARRGTDARARSGAILARVQLPLAWPALVSGALLVFVDCVKELPATCCCAPQRGGPSPPTSTGRRARHLRGRHRGGPPHRGGRPRAGRHPPAPGHPPRGPRRSALDAATPIALEGPRPGGKAQPDGPSLPERMPGQDG